MEHKGLLKLPEIWYVKITKDNREVVRKWRGNNPTLTIGDVVGMNRWEDGRVTKEHNSYVDSDFGQQITFADFKRLVLGEKNHEDYGVLGCEDLAMYFENNNVEDLEGRIKETIYFLLSRWDYEYFKNSKRQSLPLKEYLKLIEPTMEKKYEYKLRDQSHKDCVNKLIKLDSYDGDIVETNSLIFRTLSELNVLDLFFEKIEVKELPIIGGKQVYEFEDILMINGCAINPKFFNFDFRSFFTENGTHVSESEVNQIREYLNK